MTLQERGLQSEAKDIVEALVEYPTAPPTVLDRAVLLHHEEEYLEALQVLIDHDAHDAYARITTASQSRVEHGSGSAPGVSGGRDRGIAQD